MSSVSDPVAAVIALLKDDATVSGLVGTRVFGGELPESENVSMPRACVTITRAGTASVNQTDSYLEVGRVRVDVRCYGASPYEGDRVYRAVYGALKQMRRVVKSGVMLLSVSEETGGQMLRDPDAHWAFTFSSWRIMASERTVP